MLPPTVNKERSKSKFSTASNSSSLMWYVVSASDHKPCVQKVLENLHLFLTLSCGTHTVVHESSFSKPSALSQCFLIFNVGPVKVRATKAPIACRRYRDATRPHGNAITQGVKSAVNAAAVARQWYRKQKNFTNRHCRPY